MIRPVLKRKIIVNDIVELIVRDRDLACAYIGQIGKVFRSESGIFHIVLNCGHPWECRKEHIKRVGHREPVRIKPKETVRTRSRKGRKNDE